MDALSELVADFKLDVRIFADCVSHDVPNVPGGGRRTREERWRRDKLLGSGGFARVWREQCVNDDSETRFRDIKQVPKQSHASKQIDYSRELEAMIKFSRGKYIPSFVTLFGWFEDSGSIFIAMEYFQHGDLQSHLDHPLLEVDARQIVPQVVEGLEHLHDNGFAYRDIKPQNILMVEKDPEWWVKISDCGLSKRARAEDAGFSTFTGSPGYLAPEMQSLGAAGETKYTHMVDIWSLGVTTHYMLTRTFPFERRHHWIAYRDKGHFPSTTLEGSGVSSNGQRFIRSLMAVSPTDRLSAKAALQHPWLKGLLRETASTSHKSGQRETVPDTEGLARLTLTTSEGNSRSWTALNDTFDTIPDSEKVFRDLVYFTKRAGGQTDPGIVNAVRRLGHALVAQEKYADADRFYWEAYEAGKQILGLANQLTLSALHNIDYAHRQQEKYSDAELLYREAYDAIKTTCHANTLKILNFLGDTLGCQQKYEEAETCYKALHSLGHTLFLQDKYELAENPLQEVLEWKATLGLTPSDTMLVLSSLRSCLYKQVKYAKAEGILQEVYNWESDNRGSDDPVPLNVLHELGFCRLRVGNHAGAETVLQEAFEGLNRSYGPSDKATLSAAESLATCLGAQGKLSEEAAVLQFLQPGLIERYGASAPRTVKVQQSLTIAVYKQGLKEDAATLFQHVREVHNRRYGPLHERTLKSLAQLASCKPRREAEPLWELAYSGYNELYAPMHPHTQKVLKCLEDCKDDS
ncbi:kinase-like domain-containing protein [Aspergillus pseudoustus]|uniref:Serine/threonine-protein kinase ATG1 n=1 Tax=Aspergillus pseudoustus TaxID=1810923 RepID=A0ABR4JYZ0_9EURO